MAEAKILRIYLDDTPRKSAEAGKFNIFNKIRTPLKAAGFGSSSAGTVPQSV